MKAIQFPDWPEALTRAELPDRLKHSFQITIRWYLSFCKRGRAEVTVQSARDFIQWAAQQKQQRTGNWNSGKKRYAGFSEPPKTRRVGKPGLGVKSPLDP